MRAESESDQANNLIFRQNLGVYCVDISKSLFETIGYNVRKNGARKFAPSHLMCSNAIMSNVRFTSFPRTQPPPRFTEPVVSAFRGCESAICTRTLEKGLTSDAVLGALRPSLIGLGFTVEASKLASDKIKRPVFFGENGVPDLQYEIDAFHPEWRCGLEIEAGRGWMGNAVYRDLVQALVMVELDTLVLAVANTYRYQSGGKTTVSKDYENTLAVADALFGHSRISMPYQLVVVGY
jgi:hypothetical protein